MPPLTMQKKRLLQDLVDGLVVEGDLKKKDAEEFVRHFFKVIEEGLLADRLVKVNGLGVFKLIEVEARSSVDVNTGEPFLIKEHLKLSFIPDTPLKEKINKPFESYEPVQTTSEPINMKETIPDNQTDTPSVNEEPQAPTAPQKPLDLGLDEEDPFEPKEGEERQPTIQEMLAALKEENER
ncbi:MAG: HU family DNA-binding protein, partial [Bacteroidales bacterium]|nr:HU family DNA-binding protein [Bacteroidales bacterium]